MDVYCYAHIDQHMYIYLSNMLICFFVVSQVLVKNVPPDPDESVSEHVEHFFCVNHPDHYLMHQVRNIKTIFFNYCGLISKSSQK